MKKGLILGLILACMLTPMAWAENADATTEPVAEVTAEPVDAENFFIDYIVGRPYDLGIGYVGVIDLNQDGNPDVVISEPNVMTEVKARVLSVIDGKETVSELPFDWSYTDDAVWYKYTDKETGVSFVVCERVAKQDNQVILEGRRIKLEADGVSVQLMYAEYGYLGADGNVEHIEWVVNTGEEPLNGTDNEGFKKAQAKLQSGFDIESGVMIGALVEGQDTYKAYKECMEKYNQGK